MQNGYKLPVVVPVKGPPARKVSATNLDSLYASLIAAINRFAPAFAANMIAPITALHNRMILLLEHDPRYVIAYYKRLRRFYLEYIRGNKVPLTGFLQAEINVREGVPDLIRDLLVLRDNSLIDSSIPHRDIIFLDRIVAALLDGHRVVVTPGQPDYSSIVKESDAKAVATLPGFEAALTRLGISPKEFQTVYASNAAKYKLTVITTSGPNGQATWAAADDAIAFAHNQELSRSFFTYSNFFGLNWIHASMLGATPPPDLNHIPTSEPRLGRHHEIAEWGGKTRIVAMLDYWTQNLLTPLHDTINHFLRLLPSDGTFDQMALCRKAQEWTMNPNYEVNSFDLTAATDRIPIAFQADVLSYLMGSTEFGAAWKSLLIDRDYYGPDGTARRYKVGQPMGAKSSFPMLALIHHTIIQMAAIKAMVPEYTEYGVIGDDNVHTDGDVALKYTDIMGSLGVPINTEKSVLHVLGSQSAAELCKRYFVAGVEITTFPAKLIVKTCRYGHMVTGLQAQLIHRGNPLGDDHILKWCAGLVDPQSVKALYLMNSVPTEVSGLPKRIPTNVDKLDLVNWFPGVNLTDQDIIDAYTYALITEQLKRVDQLLRGTMVMSEVLAIKASGSAPSWPDWLLPSTPDAKRKTELLASLPHISYTHPIMQASNNELDRVLSHLAALRSGEPNMVRYARKGLLDLLRNSLSELALGRDEGESRVTRSVFNTALGALNRIVKQDDRVLEFSLLLAYVQRMWSVRWKLGEGVHINVIKSRVPISTVTVDAKVDKAMAEIDLSNIRV